MNNRIVLPELLDVLPPQDASALHSRRDLRRLNSWMNHPRMMTRALRQNLSLEGSQKIVELGAGDGHFLLSVAKRLNGRWPDADAILVDRLNALDPQMSDRFGRLGWRARAETAEATEWLRRAQAGAPYTIISNLFFHQFEAGQLSEMFQLAAAVSNLVVALEPRRSWLPRLSGKFLWTIGCNRVTRHDAHISIRAGFADAELSALWPEKENWQLTERPAGLFSHLFVARRTRARLEG